MKLPNLFSWILNGLLVASVAFVTFAAQSEKNRGLASATYSPNSFRTLGGEGPVRSVQNEGLTDATKPEVPKPNGNAVPANNSQDKNNPALKLDTTTPVSNIPPKVPQSTPQVALGMTINEIRTVLGVYLAGLDGKVSSQEMQNLYKEVVTGWGNVKMTAEEYMRMVAEEVQAGRGGDLVKKALEAIKDQGAATIAQITPWVTQWMKTQGYSVDQAMEVIRSWNL